MISAVLHVSLMPFYERMMMLMKMKITPVSRDDLFLWQPEMLSATGAVSHVQFSPTRNHDDDDDDDVDVHHAHDDDNDVHDCHLTRIVKII